MVSGKFIKKFDDLIMKGNISCNKLGRFLSALCPFSRILFKKVAVSKV